MSTAETLFVFVLIWWVMLFIVLPLGVRRTVNPEPGHDAGAPANPRLWQKGLLTTAAAGVLTAAIYFVVDAGLLPLREWFTTDMPPIRRGPSDD